MATDSSQERLPSFFKVIRYPSAPHLVLPAAYVKGHLSKISKTPILETETGDHSWSLKIKKIDDDYCFCDGWEKLAKDAQLTIMDTVFFSPIDAFTFKVQFFNVNGDEKFVTLNNTSDKDDEFVAEEVEVEEEEEEKEEEEEDDEAIRNENLCFQKIISDKSHRYILGLPKKFVLAAELEGKRAVTIDHEGKEWNIGLLFEKFHNQLNLSSGWSTFRQYYDIAEGDICMFKFIKERGVLSLENLLKNKRPRKNGTPVNVVHGVKRKRGRPRLERPGGGGGVKVKDGQRAEAEKVKRKRGRPRGGGGGGGGGGGYSHLCLSNI